MNSVLDQKDRTVGVPACHWGQALLLWEEPGRGVIQDGGIRPPTLFFAVFASLPHGTELEHSSKFTSA